MDGNGPTNAEMGLTDKDRGINSGEQVKRPEAFVEVNNNTATIEKPEGTYTVLYGRHDRAQDPMDIPEDTTSLMLESGGIDFVDLPLFDLAQLLQENEQYRQIMEANEAHQLPIYLSDARPRDAALAMYTLNEYLPLLSALPGAMIGLNAISDVAENSRSKDSLQKRKDFYADFPPEQIPEFIKKTLQNNPTMSRRDLLKTGGKVALGAWLTTPLINQSLQRIFYGDVEDRRDSESIKSIHKVIHPEEKVLEAIIVTARNIAIAYKNQIIMEGTANNASHMTSVLGADHYGIEDAIVATPEERIASLQEMKTLLKAAFRDSTFYSYAELKPIEQADGSVMYERTITEVPELKELLL